MADRIGSESTTTTPWDTFKVYLKIAAGFAVAFLLITGIVSFFLNEDRKDLERWESNCRSAGFEVVTIGEDVLCRDEDGRILSRSYRP